jgi:hypothetical protein
VLGEETVSPTKNLAIQVLIENTSTTRKIDFLGWSGAMPNTLTLKELLGGVVANKSNVTTLSAPERNAASLADNLGNPYKRISLDLGAQIPGQISMATSLYPGKRLDEDLLVFEPPIDKVQFLRLELPAAAFGDSGSLRLQIPKAMIRR